MQFFKVALLFAGAVLAVPTEVERDIEPYLPCSGFDGTAQCCSVSLINVLNIQCNPPPFVPSSPQNFSAVCREVGSTPACCALPALGQGLSCQAPGGIPAAVGA